MNNIFDTHAHYSSRQFDADRAELLTALPAGGVVGVLECATHSGDAAQVLKLAHAAPYFHAALGIHPKSLIEEDAATVAVYHGDWRAELAAMRPLFADKAVAAVGEIGLDHHWPVPRQEQYDLFEAQLQLAKELDLPVSVHDREAHAEMYELLRKYKPRGALHCYSGSADDAASARLHQSSSGPQARPSTSSASPLIESAQRRPRSAGSGSGSFCTGSSKYMTLTTRR